jgi:cellulose synthase (UDP-forming)
MSDPKIGIVQSPQFFGTNKELHKHSPLEYGGAQVQEAFYRFIQVARDRFGGTVCCGSNAIYRRAALDEIGGTVQIEHSEDAHTGFALTERGWIVRYVPVILAVGICPDNMHAYFHQQHRWCLGSMSLLSTKQFWQAPVPWKTKFCYICGFFFYANNVIAILFSFQLFYTLFFYNQYINIADGLLFYPYLLWSFMYLLWFPILRHRRGSFYATFVQLYAYSHAVLTTFGSKTVGWIPTNTKQFSVSRTFRQATIGASVYLFVYSFLFVLAVRLGALHLFNYNYYSVQFWIFWNIVFSSIVLWRFYKTAGQMREERVADGTMSRSALYVWQLKTVGAYVAAITCVCFAVLYL